MCRTGFVTNLLCSELKESLTRMGSDLKQGFISSLKSAWQTLNDFARAHTASAQLQAELAIVANQIEEQEKQAQEGEFLFPAILPRVSSASCETCHVISSQSIRSQKAPSRRGRRSLR